MESLRKLLGKATAMGAVAVACSGPAVEPSLESEPAFTHVVATVEKQASHSQSHGEELSVLVSVLRIPQSINGDRLLKLMGLRYDLPPLGNCEVIDLASRSSPSLSSVERIEFLDVGDVNAVSGKRTLRLARQAFPTVTDFISGVIYTSRDRNADLLPLDNGLSIRTRGGNKLKGFALEVADVRPVDKVSLDNLPLTPQARISAANPLEIRWQEGLPGDVMWVEFGAIDGHKTVSCAFDDSSGLARIPGMMTDEVGEARLTLHRLHRERSAIAGYDQAEIRFDARLSQIVVLN